MDILSCHLLQHHWHIIIACFQLKMIPFLCYSISECLYNRIFIFILSVFIISSFPSCFTNFFVYILYVIEFCKSFQQYSVTQDSFNYCWKPWGDMLLHCAHFDSASSMHAEQNDANSCCGTAAGDRLQFLCLIFSVWLKSVSLLQIFFSKQYKTFAHIL